MKNVAVSPEPKNAADSDKAARTINFDAPDGARIGGTFYPAPKENSPAVPMLHQYGSNRASYKDLAGQFQADGIAVLAIDGRGSVKTNFAGNTSFTKP